MARKPAPPISYGEDLEIHGVAPEPPPAVKVSEPEPTKSNRRPILEKTAPTLVYLDPRGKHQLRQYAVSQGLKVRVHDLLLEAIEEWGAKRGLSGPFRSPNSKPPQAT